MNKLPVSQSQAEFLSLFDESEAKAVVQCQNKIILRIFSLLF